MLRMRGEVQLREQLREIALNLGSTDYNFVQVPFLCLSVFLF